MKITYNWLNEYIRVPWEWRELVERLTLSGLELEASEDLAQAFDHVVVGHVLERRPHPNADRLSVCIVDVGGQTKEVVCGAPNVAQGQKVPVALVGAVLPGDFQIKKSKIRGVTSEGMICAEDELGLGDDHTGIMVLDGNLEPGTPFAAAMGLDDVALDFEVTPNRPDCLSVWGIAREVRALSGAELRPPPTAATPMGAPTAEAVQVQIDAPADCRRYVAQVVRSVRVGPSPRWMQQRLLAVGQRPINNVVDVTNYVLLELGQPLHAFDLERIRGRRIIVRRALPEERIQTLDGENRQLTDKTLVIADSEGPVALAGIMGGAASQVGEQTTDVLLEGAYFDPRRVRAASKQLGLQTEASVRFERGADWEMTLVAVRRAARLLAQIAGGQVAPDPLDVQGDRFQPPRISLRTARANALLATSLTAGEMERILSLLGCAVTGDEATLSVIPPSFRPDLLREVDLIEEVGRIHGYDHVAPCEQACSPWLSPPQGENAIAFDLRQRLVGLGFDEVVTNTVVEKDWMQLAGQEAALGLANPPTESQCMLRSTLIPSLLDVARRNVRQRTLDVPVFEIGTCFRQDEKGAAAEERRLGLLWTGRVLASPWRKDAREVEFLDIRGVLEDLFTEWNLEMEPVDHPLLSPGRGARVCVEEVVCGVVGEIAPSVRGRFDIERPVYIFELELSSLLQVRERPRHPYRPLPRFPALQRDLSITVEEEVAWERIRRQVEAAAPKLIESITLFDEYRGDQVPPGHRSLSFTVSLRSAERTLQDKQADRVIAQILERLETQVGARLR